LNDLYCNFCLPHSSLRRELPEPIPTKGTGSPKKWQQVTPAMAEGLTDHIMTLVELLSIPRHIQRPSQRQRAITNYLGEE
jgi:hypothetical protein